MAVAEQPDRPLHMVPTLAPFVAAGAVAIVAGGLIAAVTRPMGWSEGSWVAAYLVLVVGVGQVGLGLGQAILAPPPSPGRVWAQLALVAGSSALVIAGTLATRPVVVTVGGAVLVGALASFATAVWGTDGRSTGPRWVRPGYLGLVGLLAVSIPVGLTLSWVRA